MKRTILYLLALLIYCISAVAQTPAQNINVADNIYVYRNDGNFNAFYAGEVDSLVYSTKDLKGIEHTDVIVQEIWTPDSVYRIPLSVIDSISVNKPEIKYNQKVKKLSPDYVPYIKSTDGMQISFSNELPHSLRINKGDILLYENFDNLFENGFAGRVVSIDSKDNSLEVKCEKVDLTDIYEENISVGYYTVERDPDIPELYRMSPATRESSPPSIIPLYFNMSLNNGLFIEGQSEIAFNVKVVTYIYKSKRHIEFAISTSSSIKLDMGGLLTTNENTNQIFPRLFDFQFLIPNTIFSCGLRIAPFANAELRGQLACNIAYETSQTITVVYNDGKINLSSNTGNPQWSLGGSFDVAGDIFCGLEATPLFSTIGDLITLDIPLRLGPHLEFDIKGEFLSTDNTISNFYDSIKKSNYTISGRLGLELEFRDRFYNTEGSIIAGRYFDFLKRTYNLLPEFKNLEVESDSESIKVQTAAIKDLLIPCDVGFRIFDEDGKVIDSYYSSKQKNLDNPELKYDHTFTKNLKSGEKYTIRPLVRLWGIEFEASLEEECYLDCNVSTGTSFAAINSFEASANLESDLPTDTEVGFVYTSEKVNPTIENAKSFKASFTEPNIFKGSTSGLQQGTTYYYRAYVHYNDHYYYGDMQCVTTKRSIDLVDEDNLGGGSKGNSKPYASTGYSADEEMKSAKIGLTFNVISPSTECGYYLQADTKKGYSLSSTYFPIGTVTGNQTIELKNLIPGTKYTYWAKAKNGNGESEGQKRTFKTLPSPDPVSQILDISDISLQSATVKCYFENYQEANECGIIYEAGEFSYMEKCKPDSDGITKINLNKLTAETSYTLTPYVKTEDEVFKGEMQVLKTLGPDITGWWTFNDGQGVDGGRIHEVEIRSNGRTNNFFGVNYLTWERDGRNITMRWCTPYESNSYWEYRGTFNESFTSVTGEAVYVFDFEPTESYDEMIKSTFWLRKK